jgi:class 3 adenylate cyclase/tetratricopeptide (TPR) repeat protein
MTATVPGPPPSVDAIDASTYLKPYVPRLVIDWLRHTPTATHREIEATLVFVDISGFTALTERLAKKGKVGAEIMRDTLDGVFTALLDEAYDWGAGLLKWGGDALLLMFDGPGHPERAVRAAWEMQRTIDRVGRIHQGGGTVVLRMSVGIGTGTFHFFMAGSIHRELLIAGPAMSETLVMEAIADAGEIGLMPTLAAMLDPTIVGRPKLTTILLAGPPDVERGRAPDVGDVRDLDIAGCIPVAARAHVLLRKGEAEHRTITAAFIDLMDTDRLLAEVGPEALAAGLDERIRTIEEAAYRYEVPFYETDVGKSSVKALLTAGAPSSTGHDEERMLRTLREVMDQRGLVPMRVGVNTGKVFTGDFGPAYRRAYRVFGDAINTAARVMSKADGGQILSTAIVLERSRTIFDSTPIEPFAAKGKAALVHASIVGPVVGIKASRQAGQPLIGREAELEAILDVMQVARDGRAGIIEIRSEPGMGKTRLIEEVIARSPDFEVIRSRCEEYEASTPYFAFRAIMRAALRVSDDADTPVVIERLRESVTVVDAELLPWLPLLGVLLGLDLPDTPETAALEEQFIRDRLTEVAVAFFGAILSGVPSLFLVEDTQHLDEASRDLLSRIGIAASDRRLVLVLTRQGVSESFARPGSGLPDVLELELGPLPFHQLVAIVDAAMEDTPLSRREVEEIARRSGGNSLFLFELIDAVRETGSLESLPDSIESMIAGEIDRLIPTDRTILRYAAVLGATIDPDLLAEAVAADVDLDAGAWDRLDGLLQREPSGSLRFRNTLIRDAAYEGLPYRRRRTLHGRVGEAIESNAGASLDEEVGALAVHYLEAQRWDKAWDFCRRAAERALGVYANVEALESLKAALRAGRRLRGVQRAEIADIHERLGDTYAELGEPGRADQEYGAARRLVATDPVATARLAVKQVKQGSALGRYTTALRRATTALAALDGVSGRAAASQRARLLVWRGWVMYNQDLASEAIVWSQRGADEARRARDDEALAQAYQTIDAAYYGMGRLDKVRYSPRALELFERIGDLGRQALILNNMGVFAKDRSEWDEARAMYDRARHLFETTGDRAYETLVKYNVAEILSDQGHYEEAEALQRDVLRTWRGAGAATDAAEARRELARTLARQGHYETALRHLEDARATQIEHGQMSEVLTTDLRRAEVMSMAGRGEDALAIADDIEARAATTEGGALMEAGVCRVRGWGLLQRGVRSQAATQFRESSLLAEARRDDFQVTQALDGLLATLDRGDAEYDNVAARRDELLQRLGIIRTPPIPTGP